MNALPSLLLNLLATLPQGQDDVLATFTLDGKPAAVTRTDAALDMAFHQRRLDRGQQAIDHLVATTITRRLASAKNLLPSEAEVKTAWRELQDQLRAAGRRPEEFASMRNTTEAQWLDDLSLNLAQERLVRQELALPATEKPTAEMLQLWLQEERKKAAVVVDPDLLPAGTAVRVGSTDVPMIDLGMLLLRTAEDEERRVCILRLVLQQTLDMICAREGVQVTPSDLDAAVAKRREEAARDPRFRGATLEEMLKAQGLTIASLRELRTFRAHVQLDKLAGLRFPAAKLEQELASSRQAVLERYGPRRRIGLIFVRASDEPNGLIPRTFAQAKQHLEGVRARLQTESWSNAARIESEHASSKMQGGDTGWHVRRSEGLPDVMLAAAFALPAGEVSMPLQSEEGCFLVKAIEVEPEPSDQALVQRMRERRSLELRSQLIDEAKVVFAGAPPAKGKPK